MAQVPIWARVAPIVVEVHLCLWVSNVSVDDLHCHFGKECSCPFDFRKPLPGVFPSQPTLYYAQETQYPASSLLELWLKVF
jgi:hypothetical protein